MFDVGARIRELRDSQGLSQQDLADLTGLGRVTLSRIENNRLTPSIKTLQSICDALGVDLPRFFCPESEPHSPELDRAFRMLRELTPEQLDKLAQFLEAMKEDSR